MNALGCTHLRQWVPLDPGDSQLLPCAVGGCSAGIGGDHVKIAEPMRPSKMVSSAATFFEDADAVFNGNFRTEIYSRVRREGRWMWEGKADPWHWRQA